MRSGDGPSVGSSSLSHESVAGAAASGGVEAEEVCSVEGTPRAPIVWPDPGPLARLEHVKSQADTARVVFQRIAGGETPEQIARAWAVPVGLFTHWYTTEHERDYEAALRVRAEGLAHGALEAVDGATPETVGVAKLQADTYLRVAGKWNRKRYGEEQEAVRTTPVVIQIANLRGAEQPLLVEAPPEK